MQCSCPAHAPSDHAPSAHAPSDHTHFLLDNWAHPQVGTHPAFSRLWPQSAWWFKSASLATGVLASPRGPHWRRRGEATAAGAVQQAGGGRLQPLRQRLPCLPPRPPAGLSVLPASARPPAWWVVAVTVAPAPRGSLSVVAARLSSLQARGSASRSPWSVSKRLTAALPAAWTAELPSGSQRISLPSLNFYFLIFLSYHCHCHLLS